MYYDGTKLLNTKDINGKTPEIFVCTSNRSAGKTTYFNRLLVNRFIRKGEKFIILYRYKYELSGAAEKFFKDIKNLFFPEYNLISESREKGTFFNLYLQKGDAPGLHCGYVISINSAENIKKMSHFFSDAASMILDEFQSESGEYCPNEVNKFISIHVSISRGAGKQKRYVPVYMISNPITLLNPYYTAWGISDRLTKQMHFFRGNGFVIEQGYNKSAQQAQESSGFMAAFNECDYVAYAGQGVYLNDNVTFIDKPAGTSRYLCTLKYKNSEYAVREYTDSGIIFCDDKPDRSFLLRVSVTTADHDINYVMLKNNGGLITLLRYYFDHGCFRFKNLSCKAAVMALLSY